MFAHQWQGLLAAVEDRVDVDVEAALPVPEIAGLDVAWHADAGIVDQHVEPAEMLARGIDRGFPLGGVGDVMRDPESGAFAHFGIDDRSGFLRTRAVDIGRQHPRAFLRQADAMRAA